MDAFANSKDSGGLELRVWGVAIWPHRLTEPGVRSAHDDSHNSAHTRGTFTNRFVDSGAVTGIVVLFVLWVICTLVATALDVGGL